MLSVSCVGKPALAIVTEPDVPSSVSVPAPSRKYKL